VLVRVRAFEQNLHQMPDPYNILMCNLHLHDGAKDGNKALVPYTGNFIKEDPNDNEKAKRKYGVSPTLMGWYEIQQAFYRLLPDDTVDFDSR